MRGGCEDCEVSSGNEKRRRREKKDEERLGTWLIASKKRAENDDWAEL